MLSSSNYRFGGICLVVFIFIYAVWSPFKGFVSDKVVVSSKPKVIEPGESAIKHYLGSKDCGILQSDIYHVPYPAKPNVSPFCKNRATLLEALSSGGRHGFDEPYVGKACTYRWFSTSEICMILERFSAVVFLGDETAQTIYAALNVFLREDISHGGLQEWMMTDDERIACKCDAQFLDNNCLGYSVKNFEEVIKNEANDPKGSPYACQRTPHAYIPFMTTPASSAAIATFQSLAYQKPDPWQPTPVIFSLGHRFSHDMKFSVDSINEWIGITNGAERNIPILLLGPTAYGVSRQSSNDGNVEIWKYQEELNRIAPDKHMDILRLWNLTIQASSTDGERYGEKIALVQAMMVINWLSKLETS
ncbi:hypothetical protein OCU04_009040 [Sclerotinia nivalis]|uniref:Uncharacterized protein n=1 Tax=Sclerotinia nivalis TaxID=352851 RepID=A0A9X0AGP8_9HELO|nr:hypothetical protein OCU04_009040 [Sclerotinia nivalis]